MFGYIKACKPQMKIYEYDCYKGIYCGLCKQLGKSFGQLSRLMLSYDLSFFSLLMLATSDSDASFEKAACIANPFKKKLCHKNCDTLKLCAACSIIISYHKLRDDFFDGSIPEKLKCLPVYPLLALKRKKAIKNYKHIDDIFNECIKSQRSIESSDNFSIDAAAEPTAKALSELCSLLSDNDTQKQVLSRFGYLIGRYIYFMDALDDIEKDVKANTFNPFVRKFEKETYKSDIDAIKEYAENVINLTIGQIASCYELIELKRYKSILDNIIYLGFSSELNRVLNKNKRKEKEYAKSV